MSFAEDQGGFSSDLDVLSPLYSTGPNKKAAVSSHVGKCCVFIWVCGTNLILPRAVRPATHAQFAYNQFGCTEYAQ